MEGVGIGAVPMLPWMLQFTGGDWNDACEPLFYLGVPCVLKYFMAARKPLFDCRGLRLNLCELESALLLCSELDDEPDRLHRQRRVLCNYVLLHKDVPHPYPIHGNGQVYSTVVDTADIR
jgi:hypothetical protein